MSVRYPEMRAQIIESIQALADPTYQQRVWVDRIYPHPGFYDDLTHNVNVLYDDTEVASDPYSQVGVTLESQEEAAAIEAIAHAFDPILDSMDPKTVDAEIMAMPTWDDVVRAARNALPIFSTT